MNTLRVDDEPGSDTRWYARAVLCFVADALETFERGGVRFNEEAMYGASQTIKLCVDTLEEAEA